MTHYPTLWSVAKHAVAHASQSLQPLLAKVIDVREKSANDWVSALDTSVDAQVTAYLNKHTPDICVVSEEQSSQWSSLPDQYWILDPIDGTRNAILGIPYFAISLAYVESGAVRVGITCNPSTGQTFHGCYGEGFWQDGQRIPPLASSLVDTPMDAAIVSTGFTHSKSTRSSHIRLVEWLLSECSDIRRFGSPTLDICNLACGHFHGLAELLQPWDYAAGILFLNEQRISHNMRLPLSCEQFRESTYFVAGLPNVYDAIIRKIEQSS